MTTIMIGLDLAKNVFQIHGIDAQGEVTLQRQLRRAQVVPFFAKLVIPGILFYLALPFDVIPDFVPFIGFIDDLFVAILGLWLFLRLTPRAIFDEHMDRLGAEIEQESRR